MGVDSEVGRWVLLCVHMHVWVCTVRGCVGVDCALYVMVVLCCVGGKCGSTSSVSLMCAIGRLSLVTRTQLSVLTRCP